MDGASGKGLHVPVEDLRMLLFLVSGELKHRLQHMQTLGAALGGGEGVAVAGLALAGKGPHEIFQRLAVCKIHGHGVPSRFN